jgi:hypothetical protein
MAFLPGLVGCAFGGGRVPLAFDEAGRPGFKMLRPGVSARACGCVMWPYGRRSVGPFLERAMQQLLALDEEANVLQDLEITWRGLDVLIGRFGCVSVRADVGRMISTVSLPMVGMPPDHKHDHGAYRTAPEAPCREEE